MKTIKKSFILILILILLLQSSVVFALTYDGLNTSISNWEEYKIDEFLDTSLPYYIYDSKGNKHIFNKELWEELNLVVYGDHSSIYPNDFKSSTLNSTKEAYYSRNGIPGEYRYHGYSRNGTNLNNVYFPDDEVGSNNLQARTWIYEPWKDTSPGYSSFYKYVGDTPGDYNEFALNYPGDDAKLVEKWINQSVNFIERGTINGTNEATTTDAVHYNNIDSAPSAYSSGQGTLFHQSNYTNKIYYQTLPVEKYNKEHTEIIADIPEVSTIDIKDNGDIIIKVQVTGEIMDELYMGNSIKESIYYTRNDILEWNFTLTNNITSDKLTAKGIDKDKKKKGYYNFSLTIPKSLYQNYTNEKDSFNIILTAKAEAKYSTGETAFNIITEEKEITGVVNDHTTVEFEVNAPHKILDVDLFDLTLIEKDVEGATNRYVIVDGLTLSKADETKFVNGQYQFPRIREDKVYSYSINYVMPNGDIAYFSSCVVVYDSVPHAQVKVEGTFKENRKVTVSADTSIVTAYLNSRSTVLITEFKIVSEDGKQIYYGTNNNQYKEFLRKTEGTVNAFVTVSNEYGSRSYNHEIYIAPDYEPDIISVVWNNVLVRGEGLDIFSEGTSLYGDIVTEVTYKIYYDEDNDEIPETEVYSGTWNGSTDYIADKLGNYKIVFKAIEDFGEETISQHITAEDKRFKTVEREFFVDNLIPMTKIYTDIEYNFPNLDVAFLIDKGLDQNITDNFRGLRVDIRNNFRANSMTANVDIWDLKIYTYDQTAYKQLHTGTSYPPYTFDYNVGGYIGTLLQTNVSNYSYTVDYGGWQTFSDQQSATDYGYGQSVTSFDKNGNVTSSYSTDTPSVTYYNSGGYSGTLYKVSAWQSGKDFSSPTLPYTVTIRYTALYSGTVTRSWQEYVPNYVTVNDYYGDYSGTVYKDLKQAYNPTYQTDSNKYIIYITTDEINNMSDYNYLKNKVPGSNVIFVGNSSLENQFNSDYFIPYSDDTTELINQIISIIKDENPVYQGLTVLLNETFNLSYSDVDHESDPIIVDGFQYVHDANFFDNSLGQEAGTHTSYSDENYTTDLKTSFTKPGKYTIYRRIKDEPIGYEELGDYSNIAKLEIIAHRKPIANYKMDWDFDGNSGTYNIDWIDLSYDPDFQYSRTDKGIIDRSIKYKSSTGDWIYGVPNNLEPGTYTLEYVVMDCYNVWSDPLIKTFTLKNVPGIQLLDAKLKTENPNGSILSILKGENLLLYDVKTRYPYSHYLTVAIYQDSTRLSPIQTIQSTNNNIISQTENDYLWKDIIIPMNLSKGDYYVKVTANGNHGDMDSLNLPFSVIDIDIKTGNVNHTEQWDKNRIKYNQAKTGTDNSPNTYDVFFYGEKFMLEAETLGNPDQVRVDILNTNYSTYLTSSGNDKWVGSLWHEDMMKWGNRNLTFRFTAIQDNNSVKYIDVPIRVIDVDYWQQHRIF